MSSDEWARRQIEALELRVAALERRLAGGEALPPGDPAAEAGMDIGANAVPLAALGVHLWGL